jgi:hypothetical protein
MNTADYVKNRNDAFATLKEKGEERQSNMVDFAKRLKPTNNETMYHQHRDILQQMANKIGENLWYYTSTPSTMAEFEMILGQIDNASDQFEGYYDVTFGSEDDKPGAGTWMGQNKANNSDHKYQGGLKNSKGFDEYQQYFKSLQGAFDDDVNFDPSEGFTIGEQKLDKFIQELDPDAFMPNFEEGATEPAPSIETLEVPEGENGMDSVPEQPEPNPWADAFG